MYVKQGKINASLPEGKTAEDITLAEAVELLAAKAASKKTRRSPKSSPKNSKKSSPKTSVKGKSSSVKSSSSSQKKTPSLTKTGRLRASSVRVIKPGKP